MVFVQKTLITKRFFQTSIAKAEGSLGLTNAFMSLTPPVNKDVKRLGNLIWVFLIYNPYLVSHYLVSRPRAGPKVGKISLVINSVDLI